VILIVAACCLVSGFVAGLAVSALAHVVMRDLQTADKADKR
jgi:F0F1-type ATP synthase membrane subunit c/vacuolar-type H+-ATPase subunit K